jgi:16S rRNA (uracil1498-N3)-methyltransferase
MRENYTLKRLYIDSSLKKEGEVSLSKDHLHYLSNVLRMKSGQDLRVFNGRDGEWRASLETLSKKQATLKINENLRAPVEAPDIRLAFALVRRHRTAFIIEKATELGVSVLEPVITDRTQFPKLNLEKARTQIIEAAEQTERLDLPSINAPQNLLDWNNAHSDRSVLFADEAGGGESVVDIFKSLERPITLLVGPEGGFSDTERAMLRDQENVIPVSLGPRILRADTAALSLLTLYQAIKGDWT